MGQFGVSQAVTRREDVRLLTGAGQFVDDKTLPQLVFGYVLRSPHAHARIMRIGIDEAKQSPGVQAVYTGNDLERDGLSAIPCLSIPKTKSGTAFVEHRQPLLATDVVRFVGEGIVFIVAATVQQAQDAAELIDIEFEPLAAVAASDAAAESGAIPVWEDADANISFEFELGDAKQTAQALAGAARVISLDEINNRIIMNPMETRGAVGDYDAEHDKLTLFTNTQMPNGLRNQLAESVLHVAPQHVRVLVNDVGGGFGGRNSLYPEQALVLYAARRLKRPVKWIASRSEGFVSDFHGRDNVTRGELAVDDNGRFLALRVSTLANLGAYTASRGPISPMNVVMASNVYRIPSVYINVKAVFTHSVPTDPYRGAGRPEIIYLIERLVDVAARELGIDRVELRRRNFIPVSAFPYRTPTGLTYDPCDFDRLMDEALHRTAWDAFESRRRAAAERGKLRGIGMNTLVERCGGGGGLSEAATLRFDPDGTVNLTIGTMSNGQGHDTAYSQIISEKLGLDFDKIRVIQGDTDAIASGGGTGGSWSIPMGGGAVCLAADKVIEKGRSIASHRLEGSESDIEFADGIFTVAGTDLAVSWAEVAKLACTPGALPPGLPPGLTGEGVYAPANYTFPYGCHICEVEVDPETGAVEIIAYTAVHDFGRALNPLLLAGQVHGGLAQGIGQALFEHTVYSDEGQLLSGSFSDYCIPRADNLSAFAFISRETPAPSNPLGVKGCGEAGAAASPPAVINAVVDALAPYGIRHIDMPATPARIWEQIQRAKAARS